MPHSGSQIRQNVGLCSITDATLLDYDTVRVGYSLRVPLGRPHERRGHHRRGPAPVRPVRGQVRDGDGRRRHLRRRRRRRVSSGSDIQFATGGSWTVANPDAIVGMVGLSGIPFTNVFNACATAASAAKACADGIRLGDYDIGIAVGLDKHPRGAFTEDPALVGMPQLVRRERPVPHHPVLRHEGQPLPARPRHLAGARWPRWRPRTSATAR